jgi:hypothetical protein
MSPQPCGYRSDPRRACNCWPQQVERYLSKISSNDDCGSAEDDHGLLRTKACTQEARSPLEPVRKASVPIVPREYAGKWVAWSADGRRIVAVGHTFKVCQEAAARAGFPEDQVAIDRVPDSRQRLTGSGM